MADPIPTAVVSMPSQLFTRPDSFSAVSNGNIYVGLVDTDPTQPGNQVQVHIENEDGSLTPVPQPLRTNAAGFPVYNGQVVKFVVSNTYSMSVQSSSGVQLFYFPNILKYDQDQLKVLLSQPNGSDFIGYGDGTVSDALESLKQDVDTATSELDNISGSTGFNSIGSFLNISSLRSFTSGVAGQIVRVSSAANTSNLEVPVGGGYFKAVAKASLVDDGGVTIVPASGDVAWIRTNTEKVYIEYFGARGDGVYDSTSAILAAMAYGKAKKVNIYAGPGVFETASSIPIDSNSGLIGSGREKTIFEKTTNNAFTISTGVSADAFVVVRAPTYSPDGTDLSNYASFVELSGATFRRKGLTGRSDACAFGIWAGKVCVSQFRDVRVECGYFGFWGEDVWSNTFESIQFLGLSVRQFCGMQISRFRTGLYALSGTSNVFTLVGIANYQIGFQFNSLQYSTMNSCTADGISPMVDLGEANATAYAFINPHGITMNGCGSEGVSGSRLTVFLHQNAIYPGTVTINTYQGQIVPINPVSASTPIYSINSAHTSQALTVSLINCVLKKEPSFPNQTVGLISGANVIACNIGSIIDVPTIINGAVLKSL